MLSCALRLLSGSDQGNLQTPFGVYWFAVGMAGLYNPAAELNMLAKLGDAIAISNLKLSITD